VSSGVGALAVVGTSVRGWPERTGGSGFHIVAAVENRSPSALRLVATDATYRLVGNGPPVTGRFRYAVPDVIEPGEHGYLIDSVPIDAALARGQPTVEVTTGDGDAVADFPARLYVSGVEWTAGEAGLRVVGQATNLTGRPVLQGVAAAVAVDSAGLPIAGVVDLTDLSPLDTNQERAFELDQPETGPIDPAEVADVIVFAFDLQR
jgi:hypothetical protein